MITSQEIFNYIGIDMGWILIGTVAVCLIMLILIVVLFVQNKKLKKKYHTFMSGEDGRSLEAIITSRFQEVDSLKEKAEIADGRLNKIDAALLETYKKMALVKYDAFAEMGGSLSFVLALLSEKNDGFIINVMHSSRDGSFVYAKNVTNGKCDIELSEEETKALQEAMRK